MVSDTSLDAEKTIDPVQNNAERLGLAHVLLALDKSAKQRLDWPSIYSPMDLPCKLGHSIFEHHIHVVNGVDLVVISLFESASSNQVAEAGSAHVNQEQLCARLRQRAVIEQRELVCLLLEFLLVVAVAELVCQGTAEASQ